MAWAGIPKRVAIMLISGQKTRGIFHRYDIVGEAALREAAERLSGNATGTPTGIPGNPTEMRSEQRRDSRLEFTWCRGSVMHMRTLPTGRLSWLGRKNSFRRSFRLCELK